MSERLVDQVAIITGGSRGIGQAIAEAFSREGAIVVIASLNEERGKMVEQVIKENGGRAEFIPTDVTRQEQATQMVEHCLGKYGEVNILVNNAGVHDNAPFWEETEELWDRMYRVNVLGTVWPSQEVVRHMKDYRGGAIVNIASKAGVVGEPGHAAYSASKGAVIALTRGMAVELAPFGIRVNAICPGPVETDMLRAAVPSQENQDRLAAEAPLGRLGMPVDIAEAAVYFASSESDWCTGQALNLDGGLSILM